MVSMLGTVSVAILVSILGDESRGKFYAIDRRILVAKNLIDVMNGML